MTKSRDFRKFFTDKVETLLQSGVFPTVESIIRVVAKEALISYHALHDWYILYKSTGDYVPKADARRLRKMARAELLDLDYSITNEHIEYVKDLLRADASLTDKELSLALFGQFDKSFPCRDIHTALFKQGWTSKVMEHYSVQMNPKLVQFWRDNVHNLESNMFVYGDSTHVNPDEVFRKRGRAPAGQIAMQPRNLNHHAVGVDPGCSVFFTLSIKGPMSITCEYINSTEESMNKLLENNVLPLMNEFPGPRSILVLDNAPVYDKVFITAIFAAINVKVLFQPHKCPRLNATEPCHHLAKQWVRNTYGYCAKSLGDMLEEGYYNTITPTVAINMFLHVGHTVLPWEIQWAHA